MQWNLDETNLYITNDFSQPGRNNSKMYMEQNLDLTKSSFISKTNTIQNPNHKIYLAITKNCQHVIKDESQTDQQG